MMSSMPAFVTKELGVSVVALLVAVLVLGGGGAGAARTRGPLPVVPGPEAPLTPSARDLPVAAPRLLHEMPRPEGRNPFAQASVWEPPVPEPLAPPPERPRGRVVPLVAIGGGRAVAPVAPRVDLAAIRAAIEADPLPDLAALSRAPDGPAAPAEAVPGVDGGSGIAFDEPYRGIAMRRDDLLILKGNPEPVEGTLVEETRDSYMFRRKGAAGAIAFDKALVERVERAPRPETVFEAELQRLAPGDAEGRLNLARFCLAHDLFRQARETALAAARLAPGEPPAYRLAARAVRAEYARVARPFHVELRERELMVYERAEAAGALRPDLRLARARLLREEGAREQALEELAKALAELDPPDGDGDADGDAEGDDGDGDDDAAAAAASGGESAPLTAPPAAADDAIAIEVRLELGDLALGLGRPADAARAFEQVADHQPVAARALVGLGLARFAEGAFAEARAAFARAGEAAPNLAAARVHEGQAALAQGRVREALLLFAHAARLGDRGYERLAWEGCALGLAGRFEDGEARVAEAIALHAAPELIVLRGFLAELAGRPDEALATYVEVREAGGAAGALAAVALAALRTEEGRHTDAEAALREAARLGYTFGEVALGVARARRRMGDLPRAARFARYAEAARPNDVAAAYESGLAYLAAGQDAEAQAAFERALRLDPDDALAACGMTRLIYDRGEYATAEPRFRALAARPAPAGAYAQDALLRLQQARERRAWRDDFERPDAPDVKNRWREEEVFGLEARVRGGRLVLAGTQANQDRGTTQVVREDDRRMFVAFRARLDPGAVGHRAGIAVRTRDGEARLFRDDDGSLRYALKSGARPFEAAVDLVVWPALGGAREVEISVEGRERTEIVFRFDRREVGRVRSTLLARRGTFGASVFAEAPLGASIEVACEDVSIFVAHEE